jgi:mono/diheme cytochrome c family protein
VTRLVLVVLVGAAPALCACRTDQTIVPPDPHLERMLDQQKSLPYADEPALPGGMEMQKPPDGTLPVDAPLGDPLVLDGWAKDRWADRIPVPVDRAAIEEGRRHFGTFCAPCHGELGDGHSAVAVHMSLRPPQDLLSDTVRAYPPGRVYRTVREGYGLMPSYRVQLGVRETWSVVAYVEALQLAGGARVAELPPDVQDELAKEVP